MKKSKRGDDEDSLDREIEVDFDPAGLQPVRMDDRVDIEKRASSKEKLRLSHSSSNAEVATKSILKH